MGETTAQPVPADDAVALHDGAYAAALALAEAKLTALHVLDYGGIPYVRRESVYGAVIDAARELLGDSWVEDIRVAAGALKANGGRFVPRSPDDDRARARLRDKPGVWTLPVGTAAVSVGYDGVVEALDSDGKVLL